MPYITIKVKKSTGELLFEKDFLPHLLQSIAVSEAMNLISHGYFGNQLHYSAHSIPQYGSSPEHLKPKIMEADESSRKKFHLKEFLLIEEESKEDIPVQYFSLYIFFQDKMYVRDIPVSALTAVANRLKTTLINIGLVKKDENITCDYFIRKNNSKMREKEIIHSASKKTPSINLTIKRTNKDDLPTRKISSYEGTWRGSEDDNFPILIEESTLEDIGNYAQQFPNKEVGGILIGDVYYDSEINKIFVEINAYIKADAAIGTQGSINFTIQASEQINRIKKDKFPNKQKIGWYHSHLIRITDLSSSISTSVFFSPMDVDVHKRFSKPWQVALVVDSIGSEKWFYRWKDIKTGVIEPCKGFFVFKKSNNNEESK